ncbi:MAG: SGNH/GDSL hydrolase family protein [Oscillospiraceae bacterium]|nr:SGNH/GDSL hydrolase family protein [Oscillospiraceae bacterium]
MGLKDKSIVFLGDSITEGYGTTAPDKVFHQNIKAEHGLKMAYNAGISGTRIAKQTNFSDNHKEAIYFGSRVEFLPENADAVVVFGGTNDYGHGDAKMGDICSDDVYTFYGGLNVLYKNLKDRYPSAKLIFMTPLKRTNETDPHPPENKNLADYVGAIKAFCNEKSISLIDLYESNIFDPYDADFVPDGLHPNDRGHAAMAEYIAEKLNEIL